MLIDTRDLQTIQRAEFDEETKTFSILILCDANQLSDLSPVPPVMSELLDVLYAVPASLRKE